MTRRGFCFARLGNEWSQAELGLLLLQNLQISNNIIRKRKSFKHVLVQIIMLAFRIVGPHCWSNRTTNELQAVLEQRGGLNLTCTLKSCPVTFILLQKRLILISNYIVTFAH